MVSAYRAPFTIIKRSHSPFYYYKLSSWRNYRSTGTADQDEAFRIAQQAYVDTLSGPAGPTLNQYAANYFVWGKCPHVRRLVSEGKSITRYHVKDTRRIVENHIFTDPIAEMVLPEIKRAHVLDFRERLIEAYGFTRTVQKTMSALKTILREAYFREEIDRDPTIGIGTTKYDSDEVGAFTVDELRKLFPRAIPGPWADMNAYGVFMSAAVTGMRRGEILALQWQYVSFTHTSIAVEQAWKDRHELGAPKWEKYRVTPMPKSLISPLMHVRSLRRVYADDLVFAYPNGERLGGTWWQKNFRRGLKNAGIDYQKRNLRPHSFRHTLNTILRERGYDSERIRASMGWSDESVQNNYTHWNPGSFAGQREIIDSVFN